MPDFYSLLKETRTSGAPQRQIIYQANVTTGKPDFLYVDEERPLILDTKYKPRYGTGTFDVDDIRQLAGYARDRKALKKLGIQEAEEQSSAVVPCVIIYPEARDVDVKFDGSHSLIDQVQLEVAPIGELVGFYRMVFPLPVLSAGVTDGLRRGAGNFYVSGEADSYDPQTCTDLERLAVLQLSDDQGALFGKSWSKKETKA